MYRNNGIGTLYSLHVTKWNTVPVDWLLVRYTAVLLSDSILYGALENEENNCNLWRIFLKTC